MTSPQDAERRLAAAWAEVVALRREGVTLPEGLTALEDDDAFSVFLPCLERLFADLGSATDEVIWVLRKGERKALWLSPAFERVWQRTRADLYEDTRGWMGTVHPDDQARVREAVEAFRASGVYEQTYRILRPDGTERWIEDRAAPMRDPEGRIVRLAGIARDITDLRREIHANLERQQMVLRTLALPRAGGGAAPAEELEAAVQRVTEAAATSLEVERVSLWVFDEERTALACSDLYERSQRRHTSGVELRADDYPAYFEALLQERVIAAHDAHEDPRTREFSPGYLRPLDIGAMLDAPVRLGSRLHGVLCHEHVGGARSWTAEELGFAASLADLISLTLAEHERRRLEARIVQTQKLESLGVLAGGIAHDFNNLLQGILGNAELLEATLPGDPVSRRRLAGVRQAAMRCADLCDEMLAYSGQGEFVIEPVRLPEVVDEMGQLLESALSAGCELRNELDPALPPVLADRTQLRQVIMNLITNASEAVGDGPGVVTVQGALRTLGERELESPWLRETPPAGDYVSLVVTDTGEGMAPETLARIFDPFYTTKVMGRGLGLAALLGIVRSHHGSVQVSSTPGEGTRFEVLLPAGRDEDVDTRPADTAETTWDGAHTVLLVDDDEMVRMAGSAMLGQVGCRVLEAENGPQALALFADHVGEVDCVILDLLMPEMDGEETFRRLRALAPEVPVVLSSGYSARRVATRFPDERHLSFLKKPYDSASLLARLREATGDADNGRAGEG